MLLLMAHLQGAPVSTQDRAVRGGEAAQSDGPEGESGASVGGQFEPARLRAMQRRWIQRKANGAGGGGAAAIPGGGGAPLGGGVRARMERTLGADLGGVRVHTGGESADAAESLGARAFTVGSDVHFGRGEFAPGSKEGDRLLAHELTHVVQGQKSGVQRKADAAHGDSDGGGEHGDHEAAGHEVSEPGDPAEKEADAMGDHAADQLHGGEHGGAGGAHDAGAQVAGKKNEAADKPGVTAAAPPVGRKIFRSKDPAKPADPAKPPPIPKDAAKTRPGSAPKSAAGNAPAGSAATPPKSKEETDAEAWCATNLPLLQAIQPLTAAN
ncbi:MAG TPA: DUF4157 domain-containing protein, partial [Polyangia bacterium]